MSCRLGVVALGDSITNGGGELQYGVALQSWALWTARGLGLPYTGVAVDGARAADVVARQLPAVRGAGRRRVGPRLPLRRRQRRARARLRPGRLRARPRGGAAFLAARCERRADGDVPARPRPAAGRVARGGQRRGRAQRARGGRAAAGPARLRRAQPGDGRPRAPDRVRPGRDRRARAGRPGGRRDGRPRAPVGADRAVAAEPAAPPAGRRDLRLPPREGVGARRGADRARGGIPTG